MIQYIVDAFTDRVFSGNPAAVCVMDRWLSDELMMNIARENNLSETAFTVKEGRSRRLRWFTPGGEIDLCGHATLAAAFVIMNYYEPERAAVSFETLSGTLTVKRNGTLYEMDFPAYDLEKTVVTQEIIDATGFIPREVYLGRDLLCVFDDDAAVRSMIPDMEKVRHLPGLLLQVTAASRTDDYDCISRSFAPKLNVPEDPVCGSGHCHIIPYWSGRLCKDTITAYQASQRGGTLYCRMDNGRIKMSGKAVLYAKSELFCCHTLRKKNS